MNGIDLNACITCITQLVAFAAPLAFVWAFVDRGFDFIVRAATGRIGRHE